MKQGKTKARAAANQTAAAVDDFIEHTRTSLKIDAQSPVVVGYMVLAPEARQGIHHPPCARLMDVRDRHARPRRASGSCSPPVAGSRPGLLPIEAPRSKLRGSFDAR